MVFSFFHILKEICSVFFFNPPPPPTCRYTSDEVHREELRSVFSHSWIMACRSEQVSTPGSFVTLHVADEPLVVSRDADLRLHCLYNVCQHHAAVVETRQSGRTDIFRCPYHGWEYRLDGRLSKATQLKGIKNFSARRCGLKEAQVGRSRGRHAR